MLIAKIQDGQVVDVADHTALFPNTSFSAGGIHDTFYAENDVLPVNLFKPYNHATEQLAPCDPYIEDGQVYTMRVEPKPVELTAELPTVNLGDTVLGA